MSKRKPALVCPRVGLERGPKLFFAALLLAACSGEPRVAIDPGTTPPPADTGPRDPSDPPVPARASQPSGWDAELALPVAVDENPDPNIVEVRLSARVTPVEIVPGTLTLAWTYNGTLPGPLIRAKREDRIIVHFTNDLPEPTTIHWHGMRVPAVMDGAPGHSQPETGPGEGFTYDFTAPDAALFWYHPHVRSAEQVESGLYAPLLIDDAEQELAHADELVLVLSDMQLNDAGAPPTGAPSDLNVLFGREGNRLLVNGKVAPTLTVRPGLLQRWRIVNTARSRYFQLALAGHSFRHIGGDGGLLEYPIDAETVVLAPAERADVLIVPRGDPGSVLSVRWVPYDRGFGSVFNRPEEDLFYLRFAEPAAETEQIPQTSREIEPLAMEEATVVDLRLTQTASGLAFNLGINDVPFGQSEPIRAAVGDTQVWSITNTMNFAHPFHLHGFFFQVLDKAGSPTRPLQWKDTVDVPVDATTRFVVHYEGRPGMWMFHCHILDHADAGMMGMLELGEHTTHQP